MIRWPFTKQHKQDEETRNQVSSAIHQQIAEINSLVVEIKGSKGRKSVNGTKHSTISTGDKPCHVQ
jgi:hypothetical protein